MRTVHATILDDFPYPIAYPYSLIFSTEDQPSTRRWALCFTEYQLLRFVCLSLVSQYLREEIDETAVQSISGLNTAIAGIRSPFFGDWITLAHTLRRHLTKVGVEPLFPGFAPALEALTQPDDRPIGLRGNHRLDPLNAILALRNQTAHGGLPDQAEAAEHIEQYLPVLQQVLAAFKFLGESRLKVHCGQPEELLTGKSLIRTLRGAQPPEACLETLTSDLEAAFAESVAIVIGPQGKTAPLYPLFKTVPEREPLFLYDGHYGIQVATRQGPAERSYIYYLGTHARITDIPASEHLRELLARRRISFFLEKDKTAPWTIADSALDYSRRTLGDLVGTKYFPQCYLPFEETEREFESFLRVPDQAAWPPDRARRRYVNGFVLVGLAGAGKTAFLARQCEKLLGRSEREPGREKPNLILFLRGNAITLRAEGMSLFRDVAERLGIAVAGASTKSKDHGGFSSFRELLDHLDGRWKQDRVEGRRLILILDAINEAPYAETVIREALDMAGEAARYPWCKIVFSIRQEWLGIWSGKMGAQEISPLEELRPFLRSPAGSPDRQGAAQGPPVITLEPFTAPQAAEVYGRYQAAADQSRTYTIPACTTTWNELIPNTRALLTNPLYLHLFMAAFDRRTAEPLVHVPTLFQRYVDAALAVHSGLRVCVEAVVSHLLQNLARASADLTDDDGNQIRDAWAGTLSVEEARLSLSPVEALAHEGIIRKRVREEGGGYRFVFQTVAEYLIFRHIAQARPPQEEEIAYWLRQTNHSEVFSEYAGAFGFLLRDWDSRGTLSQAVQLVELSPAWMQELLTTFLVEQVRVGYVAARGGPAAERAVRALASTGRERTAAALLSAGNQVLIGPSIIAAQAYLEAACEAYENLHQRHPDDIEITDRLGGALNNLGNLMRSVGRVAVAEKLYRRSVEIREVLFREYPDNVDIAMGLGMALNNLGVLLRVALRAGEAEPIYRRSVEISEAVIRNSAEGEIAQGLIMALNNLGVLLRDTGRTEEAVMVSRRAVEKSEELLLDHPEEIGIANELGSALNNLANVLADSGRTAEAMPLYWHSIEIREALLLQTPEVVEIAVELAISLNNLGLLLRDTGDIAQSEMLFYRAIELGEAAYVHDAENLERADRLGSALNNLGVLLSATGRLAEAAPVLHRSVEIREAMYRHDPENVELADGLGGALNNLSGLLQATGSGPEAETACRRSITIYDLTYHYDPTNVAIANGLGLGLSNLGNLLQASGRTAEAEQAWRRSVDILESLFRCHSENIGIKTNYAGVLCSLNRYAEARVLLDQVLAAAPGHPYASQLARFVAERPPIQSSKSPGLSSVAHPAADPDRASQLNAQFIADFKRWKALPWWKRQVARKPQRPTGI